MRWLWRLSAGQPIAGAGAAASMWLISIRGVKRGAHSQGLYSQRVMGIVQGVQAGKVDDGSWAGQASLSSIS